jgi:hypothetical protein
VFVSDEELDEGSASWSLDIWGSDCAVELPTDGSRPDYETFFPPAQGFRVSVGWLPPEPPLDERREADRRQPTTSPYAAWDNDGSGMHRSQTVDVGFVHEGEVFLELDDGVETRLTAGTFVVQNGTRHAWHNRADQPCRMLFAKIGASPPTV